MPAVVLAQPGRRLTRMIRVHMEVLTEDYFEPPEPRLRESIVVYRHALRNARFPLPLPGLGLLPGTGSVIVEVIFALRHWAVMISSLSNSDYFVWSSNSLTSSAVRLPTWPSTYFMSSSTHEFATTKGDAACGIRKNDATDSQATIYKWNWYWFDAARLKGICLGFASTISRHQHGHGLDFTLDCLFLPALPLRSDEVNPLERLTVLRRHRLAKII